ncbi:MAG: amidohydrolase family protein [Reyranella sp.]|uniref:N-acyl-D-amino-acid deacylase family protein n=1 Tax=Reyranella sp. TaxID=1929291 RepID=UPI001AD298EC|nr:amidohydrolase family protein [Reyranella sp.]MBN9088014.1 amidohydrolase family protein [Reyranella sp.]
MSSPDLVIRNGTIVDGSGGDPYEADLAIADGKIAAIGGAIPKGAEEIDARGKLVTPGFVDVHTHYDAQVTWSERLSPSSWNGATTVMLGNCGVGFAPCHEDQHDMLINLMEGVEDIPEVVLSEGLPWNWHSFPDYLDALAARRYDADITAQVPHAALRVYVMGERGANREPATEQDRHRMAQLTAEGLRAGALGFSTSRTLNHKSADGKHIPTLRAEEAELTAIAHAMRDTGIGWMQIVSDFQDQAGEIGLFRRMAKESRRPVTISLLQSDARPDGWRELMAEIDEANEEGLRITAQVRSRPTSVLLGFELSQNPFMGRPSYKAIARLPFPERLAILRQPEFRARVLAEAFEGDKRAKRVERWDRMYPLGDPPDYEPKPEHSIAARAAREGRSPEEVAYDLLLERDGREMLYLPVTNYAGGNLDVVREMIAAPNSLIGLGDGGAHVGIMCDATATSYTLTHWTRDRGRGALFPVSWAIKRLSADNAHAIGLTDRGLLKPGLKADLNVLDYDAMKLRAPEVVYDLPAGGRRLVQRTEGFDATIVSGAVVYRDGEATGALPGRLVRSKS